MSDSLEGERFKVVPFGMTDEALGQGYADFANRSVRRILTVGSAYSEGDHQQFESMPLGRLFEMALEELEDLSVYAAMLHIRIQRVRAELEAKGVEL